MDNFEVQFGDVPDLSLGMPDGGQGDSLADLDGLFEELRVNDKGVGVHGRIHLNLKQRNSSPCPARLIQQRNKRLFCHLAAIKDYTPRNAGGG